ncbi:gag-protease polyprotein [Cucumis melo var. makuwa]|uniref:Gag-protease polyprotein n=1 Tax=Cucumis melo var. makuwa TaxID=1194695 RepID=A0A5A7TR27_CUCMM|nr:gag-protease polyprotein [Cucumis melo var. makuwa]
MAMRSLRHSPGKMPPRRGARRGGGGSRRDGAAISGYATGCFSVFSRCPANPRLPCSDPDRPSSSPEGAQPMPMQLSAEAKHLRDFRKYNPKTFDGSMDNPTKAQMWLTSIETIFRYMKCPDNQKVQCAVFFLEDRGTAWWETAERMLGGDHAKQQEFLNLEQGDMTVEQYDVEFDMLSRFVPDVGFVRALRPATHANALRIALDLSLHERADSSKAAGRGSALGQKRKVESQPDVIPQRNLRSGSVFQRHRRELAAARRTLRDLPIFPSCGRVHGACCLAGSGVCFRCRQPGHTADACPWKPIKTTPHQPPASQQGRVFATTHQEAKRAGTVVTSTFPILGHYAFVLFDSGHPIRSYPLCSFSMLV